MNISGVRLHKLEPSGYANPLEDEGTLTEQEKEVKKMDKKSMTETLKDLIEKQREEKEIINDEIPQEEIKFYSGSEEVYRMPKFLNPKELEKERQRLLNNTVGIVATPAAEDVKLLTPCEMYGHNYRIVWHDEKSISHRTLLVCAKCGETKEVYF